LIGRLEKRT